MLKFAYCEGKRVEIKSYSVEEHQGKIVCGEGHPLIAKRGEVIQHHYAHLPGYGDHCGASDGKTSWHLWWQDRLQEKFLEFRIQKEVLKIADAVNLQDGKLKVIEFQNSVMSKTEMAFREKFYTRTDLLSSLGVPYCQSELFWVFNAEFCSLQIELIFGDYLCGRLTGGSKYMLEAKATAFLDFGKRQLVQILALDKVSTEAPMLIGRIISLELLDQFLFKDILIEEKSLDKREYRHPLIESDDENFFEMALPIEGPENITNETSAFVLIELKKFYFEKSLSYKKFLLSVSEKIS